MYKENIGISLPAESRADRNVARSSKGHCVAHTVLGRGAKVRVQAESLLELANLLILNANPEVVFLKEQARFVWEDERGKSRNHYFDAIAEFRSGEKIAFTVKPSKRVNKRDFLDEMALISIQAVGSKFCHSVRLITEKCIDPVALRNAEMFQAIEDNDPEADELVTQVVMQLRESLSLQGLTNLTGLGPRGYRAVIRLCRDLVLVPVELEAITWATLLRKAGEVQ